MEDQQIVELYWQRSTEAITQSKEKYGAYCFSVAEHILQSQEDCEECVNDTWFRAWNTIPPSRPHVLRMFLAKLTRSISFDRWRQQSAQKRGGGELPLVLEELSQCIAADSDVEDTVIAEELEQTIRAFLHTLPERTGDLFLRRYFFTESVEEIAVAYGITSNHVAVTLSRARKQLRQHLKKEGYFHESN